MINRNQSVPEPPMMKDKNFNEAAFNSALGQTIRLNGILDLSAQHAMNLDALKWYHTLRQVYREIFPKMETEEKTNLLVRLTNANIMVIKETSRKSSMNMTSMSNGLYDLLDSLDCELRYIADQHGLLIPKKRTFMDALAEEQ